MMNESLEHPSKLLMKHKPMLKAVPRRSRYKSSRTETSCSNLQKEQIVSKNKKVMQNPSNPFHMATVFFTGIYRHTTVQVEDIGPKIRAYNAPACQTRTRLRL